MTDKFEWDPFANADAWARAHGLGGKSAGTSSRYEADRATLQKLMADRKRKYPDAVKVETEIGPRTLEMMQLADAVRRERRGEVGEASSGLRSGYLGIYRERA